MRVSLIRDTREKNHTTITGVPFIPISGNSQCIKSSGANRYITKKFCETMYHYVDAAEVPSLFVFFFLFSQLHECYATGFSLGRRGVCYLDLHIGSCLHCQVSHGLVSSLNVSKPNCLSLWLEHTDKIREISCRTSTVSHWNNLRADVTMILFHEVSSDSL